MHPTKFSGKVLIIFKSNLTIDLIYETLNKDCKDDITAYFCPFIYPRSQYFIHGQRISINKAPEPSDILWDNIGYTQK
jgi:hypothetical protein